MVVEVLVHVECLLYRLREVGYFMLQPLLVHLIGRHIFLADLEDLLEPLVVLDEQEDLVLHLLLLVLHILKLTTKIGDPLLGS